MASYAVYVFWAACRPTNIYKSSGILLSSSYKINQFEIHVRSNNFPWKWNIDPNSILMVLAVYNRVRRFLFYVSLECDKWNVIECIVKVRRKKDGGTADVVNNLFGRSRFSSNFPYSNFSQFQTNQKWTSMESLFSLAQFNLYTE